MKRIALVLCAVMALGSGVVSGSARHRSRAARRRKRRGDGVFGRRDDSRLERRGGAGKGREQRGRVNTLAYFLRMVFVLALVLAAIYGVYRLMKRASRPKAVDDNAVRVLATTSLGPGKALHIVALDSKAYLIGATDTSISLVAEVADKDFIDRLGLEAALAPKPSKAGADFGEMLAGLLGGRRRAGGKRHRGDGDFLAGQRERLRKF